MKAKLRVERDSLGEVEVDASRLWGAQTQRSLTNFRISSERMPSEVIMALALVKKAAATANAEAGKLAPEFADAIVKVADEIVAGDHADEFPLLVWQTGSGTQTNMNMNEVIANRGSELLGAGRGQDRRLHPNDHVNKSQSSNDAFSTAMNLACWRALNEAVIPSVRKLTSALAEKADEFSALIKIGRTHLQDATPITLGQEISGWVAQLEHSMANLASTLPHLSELTLGGTAVGTGLNSHPGYAERVAQLLSEYMRANFVSAPNKFEAQAAHDAIVFAHGALKALAVSLTKIANDVRWLASGPRAGLGELAIPSNEPGSSIMPGKVNPTQCEAMLMCTTQVLGNDTVINVAGASGNFELNVQKPVMVHAFLQSARLLADACESFRQNLVMGMQAREDTIQRHVAQSLMLVTALAPHIGYDKAASIAKQAHVENITLREAAVASGWVSAEDFDNYVRPEAMLGPAAK